MLIVALCLFCCRRKHFSRDVWRQRSKTNILAAELFVGLFAQMLHVWHTWLPRQRPFSLSYAAPCGSGTSQRVCYLYFIHRIMQNSGYYFFFFVRLTTDWEEMLNSKNAFPDVWRLPLHSLLWLPGMMHSGSLWTIKCYWKPVTSLQW